MNEKEETYSCACCGYLTRSEPDFGTYEICPICCWEDSAVQSQEKYKMMRGGPNGVSLEEARANFKKFGASEQRYLKMRNMIRKPYLYEIPDKKDKR